MRAAVCDGEDLSIQIGGDENGQTIDLDRDEVTSGNVVRLKNSDPFFLSDEVRSESLK